MIPWEFIDSADVPGAASKLHLYRRGNEYSIRVDAWELMNSRVHSSEDALADLVCKKFTRDSCPRILIGGLGMGFTLAAALRSLGSGARVVVSELVSSVVEWNRGVLAELAGHPLDDRRTVVREADVAKVIKEKKEAYDALLLDVDNGPEGMTCRRNNWLYSSPGLEAAAGALRPGGVLAVWSASPEKSFSRKLAMAGFEVEEVRVGAHTSGKGPKHIIWLCVLAD